MSDGESGPLLKEKVALVTGGATRLGREICLGLAANGCDVVVHYMSSSDEADEVVAEIKSMGRDAWPLQGDFLRPHDAEIVMRTAWELGGWVDIVVNNAGIFETKPFSEASEMDFERMWRINTQAPMVIAATMFELVCSSKILPAGYCAKIVNIIDQRVHKPCKGCLPYWMSKKALADFTECGALELAPRIAMNGVSPGPVLVPVAPEAKEPAGEIPMVTRCIPSDIVSAVLFLAASMSITGEIIHVDGGQHLL